MVEHPPYKWVAAVQFCHEVPVNKYPMNILIMGCSFGVPGQYPGCVVSDHTEHQLRSFGHIVHNVAQNGGSNINSLNRAKNFLAGKSILSPQVPQNSGRLTPTQEPPHDFVVDWIVWFHTELRRDKIDLDIDYDKVPHVVYSQYFEFVKNLKAKLAVIGGAGPIHPILYSYGQPDFAIDSWFNEILNLDLPQIQTLSNFEYVNKMQDVGLEKKLEFLEQHLTVLKALQASPDFPDNYHPGNRPHRELAIRLHKRFAEKQ